MSNQDERPATGETGVRRGYLWLLLAGVVLLFGGCGVVGLRAGYGPGMAMSMWLVGAFLSAAIIFGLRMQKR